MTVEIRHDEVASRAHTPARVAPTRIGAKAKRVGSSTTATATRAGSSLAALASRYAATEDAWAETPASVRACLEYTREGGWVPGDRAVWLETLGKAYGYVVAVPVTTLLFTVVWTVQKPSRLCLVGLALALAWFAAGLIL